MCVRLHRSGLAMSASVNSRQRDWKNVEKLTEMKNDIINDRDDVCVSVIHSLRSISVINIIGR